MNDPYPKMQHERPDIVSAGIGDWVGNARGWAILAVGLVVLVGGSVLLITGMQSHAAAEADRQEARQAGQSWSEPRGRERVDRWRVYGGILGIGLGCTLVLLGGRSKSDKAGYNF